MKHALLPAMLVLGLAGCIENRTDSPLKMLGSYVVSNECALDMTVQLGQGALDLAGPRLLGDAAALNVRYLALFDVRNEMTDVPIQNENQELASAARNSANLNKLSLTYRSAPNLNLRTENVAISFTLAAGGQQVPMVLNLVGPVAAQSLLDNVLTGDTVSLTVTAQLSGTLNSGGTIESNLRPYTIQVYDSGLQCRQGEVLERNGPCFNIGGQDDKPATCASADAGTDG
ncbi:MAG: hypothetical protein FJ086_06395 [Deltaproteobacteria bacterium]|nr:hypothetical protein [Deltaproteobacteria bacterium]